MPFNETGMLERASGLREKMMSSVLVMLISRFLGRPGGHIKLEIVQSLESLGWSYKYVSFPEKIIKIVG